MFKDGEPTISRRAMLGGVLGVGAVMAFPSFAEARTPDSDLYNEEQELAAHEEQLSAEYAEKLKGTSVAELEAQIDSAQQEIDGYLANGGSMRDFLTSSVGKGISLAVDAAFLYLALYPSLEKKDRLKLNAAMTIAHVFFMSLSTLGPEVIESFGENQEALNKTITAAGATVALGFVMKELSGEDGDEADELENLIGKVEAEKMLKLALVPGAIWGVSYDAAASGAGTYTTMKARGFNTAEVAASVGVAGATILGTLALTDLAATAAKHEYVENAPEKLKDVAGSAGEVGKKAAAFILNIDPTDEDATEEIALDLVYMLIASYGFRGLMDLVGYEGHQLDVLGINVESAILGAGSVLALKHSDTLQQADSAVVRSVGSGAEKVGAAFGKLRQQFSKTK